MLELLDGTKLLTMHPTLKPVALVKDALLDCSKRGGVVLDCFGGAGTTLIAAEVSGRAARLIECDPLFCDATIRRYEMLTGKSAHLEASGACFELLAEQRLNMSEA